MTKFFMIWRSMSYMTIVPSRVKKHFIQERESVDFLPALGSLLSSDFSKYFCVASLHTKLEKHLPRQWIEGSLNFQVSGAKDSEDLNCVVRKRREKRAIMHNQLTLLTGQQAKEMVRAMSPTLGSSSFQSSGVSSQVSWGCWKVNMALLQFPIRK